MTFGKVTFGIWPQDAVFPLTLSRPEVDELNMSDGHRQKGLPLAFCLKQGRNESVAEGASAGG